MSDGTGRERNQSRFEPDGAESGSIPGGIHRGGAPLLHLDQVPLEPHPGATACGTWAGFDCADWLKEQKAFPDKVRNGRTAAIQPPVAMSAFSKQLYSVRNGLLGARHDLKFAVVVTEVRSNQIKLSTDAPVEVKVIRDELLEQECVQPRPRNQQKRLNHFAWLSLSSLHGGEAGMDSAFSLTPSGRRRFAPASCAATRLVEPAQGSRPCAHPNKRKRAPLGPVFIYGGEAGIRTLGAREGTTDFESVPFGHSGTSPICFAPFAWDGRRI